MKKVPVIIPLVLSLALTACSDSKEIDTQATATALLASEAFSEQLEYIDPAIATNLYYLDAAVVSEVIVYGSTGATAEEIAIITAVDEASAAVVYQAMELRMESQLAVLASYQPAEVEKLEDAILIQEGTVVMMVVSADSAVAQDLLP